MQDIRNASVERFTRETQISLTLSLAPQEYNTQEGQPTIDTGIPFLDHMLLLLAVHGFMGLCVKAKGDLAVDHHHTVEDIGLVLGEALDRALGDRKSIRRYGHVVIPMDETLAAVTIDLSRRPYLVYQVPETTGPDDRFGLRLAKEFFRAVSVAGGMNLHINIAYGENEHHMLEAIFKAFGRALDQAVTLDLRVKGVCSTKGAL